MSNTQASSDGFSTKLDLLFMIDNSNSMSATQEALRKSFPTLIEKLTTGQRAQGAPFAPALDIHVGVVSSDMGIPGVDVPPSCHADGGDDGRLRHDPHGTNCAQSYPSFLQFSGDPTVDTPTDSATFANDVACIATLGTGGCGFEQQLESPFKALWPKNYRDASGNPVPDNPYRFISVTQEGTWGRGDIPVAQGGNAGFLRSAAEGSSLLAVIVVTDEDDCSVRSTDALKPSSELPQDSPYRDQDMNLRCHYNPQFLYDLRERYYNGFRALRPDQEDSVLFGVIAGVPSDLVSPDLLARVDRASETSTAVFYDSILTDPRMQEEVDPATNPGSGMGNLRPSCVYLPPGSSTPAMAYPPRRLVELAKMFGPNGLVQSICQNDFEPTMGAVAEWIGPHLAKVCPR